MCEVIQLTLKVIRGTFAVVSLPVEPRRSALETMMNESSFKLIYLFKLIYFLTSCDALPPVPEAGDLIPSFDLRSPGGEVNPVFRCDNGDADRERTTLPADFVVRKRSVFRTLPPGIMRKFCDALNYIQLLLRERTYSEFHKIYFSKLGFPCRIFHKVLRILVFSIVSSNEYTKLSLR
jgi:hypothetical protein